MATQVQFRGGTTTEHASFNGAAREVTVDTTKQTLVVQDGSTNGGFPLLRENGTQSLITTGDIKIDSDTTKLYAGADYELQVFHNGTDSVIKDTRNAGSIKLQADNFSVIDKDAGQTLLSAVVDGATKLFYGGATTPKLATTSQGINLEGNGTDHHILDLHNTGSGKGSQIKFRNDHEGGAYIGLTGDTTGDLRVYTEKTFKVVHGSDTAITSTADGAVQLYNDDVLHFTTHSLGIKVLGATGGTAQIDIQPDQGADNADKWKVGAEDDGHFFISNKDSGAWDKSIAANRSGNVELYYDGGTAKFETTSTGAKVNGKLLVDGAVEYDAFSSSSIHVDGYICMGRTDTTVASGNSIAGFRFYSNDTNINSGNFLNVATIDINADGDFLSGDAPTNMVFKTMKDGTTTLTEAFRLDSNQNATFAGSVYIPDGQIVGWGDTTPDMRMYHVGGGNSYINNRSNNLYVQSYNAVEIGSTDQVGSNEETSAKFVRNGACQLFYDDSSSPKFETKSTGARVTGNFEAYADSNTAASAGTFYNNNSTATADCRVQIKTYSNQGADPFIHFDSGGTNFIVGQRWMGTTDNYLVLGPGESPSGGVTGGIYVQGSGRVGLNTTGGSYRLNVSDTGTSCIWTYTNSAAYYNYRAQSNTNTGTQYYFTANRLDGTQDGYLVSSTDGQINLANGSDYRLKDNVVSMTNGIDIIKKLNPVTYKWKASTGRDTSLTMQGFLAHEVDEAGVIGVVDGEKDGVWDTAENPAEAAVGDPRYQGLCLDRLIPSLTAALKEAIAKIETLEAKVAALESS